MLVRKLNVALPDWYWTGAPGFPEQVTLPSVLRKGGAKLSKTFNSLRKKAVKVTRGVVIGGHGGPGPPVFYALLYLRVWFLRACSSKGQIVILGRIVSASGQIFRSDFRPQDEMFRPLDEQALSV